MFYPHFTIRKTKYKSKKRKTCIFKIIDDFEYSGWGSMDNSISRNMDTQSFWKLGLKFLQVCQETARNELYRRHAGVP